MRKVIMFNERFAAQVEDGSKRHTIRKAGTARNGDLLSLRTWAGKPYRSPQTVICEKSCLRVMSIAVDVDGVTLDDVSVSAEGFAKADGFDSWAEMRDYFARTYGGLPFFGDLIEWGDRPEYERHPEREPVPEAAAVEDVPAKKRAPGGRSGGRSINLFCGQGRGSRTAAEKVCHMPLMGYVAMLNFICQSFEVKELVFNRALQAGLVVFDPCTGLWTGTNKAPAVGWEWMPENEVLGDV